MKLNRILAMALVLAALPLNAQKTIDEILPVRGLAIEAPSVRGVDRFVGFINEELVPAKVNLLILRVDWNFDYKSHPELRDEHPLTQADVDKITAACKAGGIRVVPQINLLGHQSWAKETGALLRVYPEFDETPSVKTENYTGWPNPDGLYCKSYCPLHPGVHKIVFELIDEICDAFGADAFHAGMDEVFYIGMDECPRCKGKDRSELYAGEVKTIHDHLAESGRQLMIWGDRLLDGNATGLGEWEASTNDTWRAVDMIPKDVFICDWHYERAELSAIYFAAKGLPVATCGYRSPEISVQQVRDIIQWRSQTNSTMASHLQGYIHTIWSGADQFLRAYYDDNPEREGRRRGGDAKALKAVLAEFRTF